MEPSPVSELPVLDREVDLLDIFNKSPTMGLRNGALELQESAEVKYGDFVEQEGLCDAADPL